MYLHMIWRSVVLYLYIILIYRVMGKKELGKLSMTDFIISVLMAECAVTSIFDEQASIWVSILPITILGLLEIFLSFISMKSDKFRKLVEGTPSVIIKKGKLMFSSMSKLRYTLDDLVMQLRQHGVKSVEEVNYAVLENDGKLSIFKRETEYPLPIILDGVIEYRVLKEIGKDVDWVNQLLHQKSLHLEEIFYAFYTKEKTFIITRKDLL